MVSIEYVQTPWCRDIHSLFPVPPEEAGGTKDYEMSFLNPSFVLFDTFFPPFFQLVLFFLPLLLLLFWKLSQVPMWYFFFLIFTYVPVSQGCLSSLFFTVEQWWRVSWDNDYHPLLSLTVWLAVYLPLKWLVWPRTGHQNESTPHLTRPWVLTYCTLLCHFTINFSQTPILFPNLWLHLFNASHLHNSFS